MIDDEPSVALVVGVALRANGYLVESALNGADGLRKAAASPPDLIVLDLGLPDIDGVEVCRHLRRFTLNPIVVLSADGAEERKVMALDEGADDYLTKPFSMPELLARMRVATRHRAVLAATVDGQTLRCGPIWVDTAAHCAGVGDTELVLTAKEFALLRLFVHNKGRVLTHKAVLEQVWDAGQDIATLRTHMAQLRRKLLAAGPAPEIETEAGIGYRLTEAGA